jgi:uncharacterized protein (DUF2141 family)
MATRTIRGCVMALAACALPLVHAAPQASASVAGIVVSADAQAQPIRRAVVTLTGAELPTNVSAVTDDRGGFVFVNLRPGTYMLTASKAAYLTTAFGAKRPERPGTPLTVGAGERVAGLTLTLARGAVLSGTVRDPSGAPARNVQVTIAPAAKAGGLSDYASPPEGPLITDDRGMYRAYGLAPGEYLVAATPDMPRGSALVRLPVPTIDAVMRDLQMRAAGGASSTAPPEPPPSALQPMAYAPVFYPGTPVTQEASRIRVAAGEVRDGLDFAIDFLPSVKIEGTIVMADGSPMPGVQLSLTPVGPPLPVFFSLAFMPRQSPDGTFSFTNVTPGHYVLLARGTPGTPPTNSSSGRGGFSLGNTDAGSLWAMADFNVSGADLKGVTLTMRPALKCAGRILFDATSLAPPADLTKVRVGLVRAGGQLAAVTTVNGAPVPGLPSASPATVRADGTFIVGGVLPATYTVSASVPGAPGWSLRSAIINGRDALDYPLDFGAAGADVSEVVLTFSDKHSELSGTLRSASGQAAADYSVIVFPADRALWRADRRLKSTRPSIDGRFTFADLPAGEYLIAAVVDVDPDEWRAPAFLEEAAGASAKITIADGAKVRQDLRIR